MTDPRTIELLRMIDKALEDVKAVICLGFEERPKALTGFANPYDMIAATAKELGERARKARAAIPDEAFAELIAKCRKIHKDGGSEQDVINMLKEHGVLVPGDSLE